MQSIPPVPKCVFVVQFAHASAARDAASSGFAHLPHHQSERPEPSSFALQPPSRDTDRTSEHGIAILRRDENRRMAGAPWKNAMVPESQFLHSRITTIQDG